MRFSIQGDTPYLVSGGKAYPVEITEERAVKVDYENGSIANEEGYLTLDEVIAKVGITKKKKARKTQKEEQ